MAIEGQESLLMYQATMQAIVIAQGRHLMACEAKIKDLEARIRRLEVI